MKLQKAGHVVVLTSVFCFKNYDIAAVLRVFTSDRFCLIATKTKSVSQLLVTCALYTRQQTKKNPDCFCRPISTKKSWAHARVRKRITIRGYHSCSILTRSKKNKIPKTDHLYINDNSDIIDQSKGDFSTQLPQYHRKDQPDPDLFIR